MNQNINKWINKNSKDGAYKISKDGAYSVLNQLQWHGQGRSLWNSITHQSNLYLYYFM